ncbi:hypothetical protein B296_00019086 [Ensete ventricosum]|uniref:Uncharacterized protein n=1 Tax=Ensete ventricosum TaxID=4639 RepID=A0A426Z7G0_ENSVE|nr:hypothetical protein B296_00019086 [Ensete ventricosum]
MAAIADSGSGSDSAIARSPAKGAGGLAGEARWVEDALRGAEDLKQTVTAAAESAFQAAGSSAEDLKRSVTAAADSAFQSVASVLSRIVSDSSESLEEAKVPLLLFTDGIVDAALHPALSCGIAAGLGLALLKGPRRFLIRNARRIFVSEEVGCSSMLSSAQVKVKELQQSVNLVTNESKKLEVSTISSQIKQEKKALNGALSRIINHGIPM